MASLHIKDEIPGQQLSKGPDRPLPESTALPTHQVPRQPDTPEPMDPATLPAGKTFLEDANKKDDMNSSDIDSESSAVIIHRRENEGRHRMQETLQHAQSTRLGRSASEEPQMSAAELEQEIMGADRDLPELPSDDPSARPSSRRHSKPHNPNQTRSSSSGRMGGTTSSLIWPFGSSGGSSSKHSDTQKLKLMLHKRDQEIEALHEKLSSISDQYGRLHDRYRTLESDLRIAQEGAFRNMQKAQWTAEDDSWVESHFAKLETYLKSWARDYAIERLSSINLLEQEERGFVESLIRTVSQYSKDVVLPPMPARLDKKATSYLLLALLSDFIYRNIIGDPFFFLEDHTDTNESGKASPSTIFGVTERGSARQTLNNIFNTISKVNSKDASDWRFQTLRLLDPPTTVEPSRDNALKHRILALRKETSQRFALLFRSSAAGSLLRRIEDTEQSEKSFRELCSLFKYAGELSYRLWTQRTELRVLGLPELRDRRFAIRSDLLEAHALHKLDDDEDESLDGCPIKVVISPAVVAFGNADGSDGGRPKILMKATVWLDEGWKIR